MKNTLLIFITLITLIATPFVVAAAINAHSTVSLLVLAVFLCGLASMILNKIYSKMIKE